MTTCKAQQIKFYDYVLINGIKVKSIIIDDNDMLLLIKQSLKYNLLFDKETLYNVNCIYKDAIEAIRPSYNIVIKANYIIKCGCSDYNAFEVKDQYIPCFNYIGKTEHGYIVSFKEGYSYSYNKDKRELIIK